MEEGWQTLAQLQKEGKVRYIGVSNFNVAQMKQVARIAPITSLQPNYNIVTRDIEKDLLPFCRERHIGVIVYSPMKSGLLTGKMTWFSTASGPQGSAATFAPMMRDTSMHWCACSNRPLRSQTHYRSSAATTL
jgi:aryl-alcohol dehydrogenase-like predicted oxidoreductase